MNDHGRQPTSMDFMRACTTLKILQTFTSSHHRKAMRTLKEKGR